MKKLYLDEMVKYDKDIESLYTYKSTLLTEKDYINNEYAIIQVSQKYYLIFILYIYIYLQIKFTIKNLKSITC